ncbi:hypothetical protein KSZ02_24990, partial [Bacteroides thetaiotaomicron]
MKSIKDELNSNPNGFKYETLTTDANIRKSVDDIVYGAYGEDNPHPLEWYPTVKLEVQLLHRLPPSLE